LANKKSTRKKSAKKAAQKKAASKKPAAKKAPAKKAASKKPSVKKVTKKQTATKKKAAPKKKAAVKKSASKKAAKKAAKKASAKKTSTKKKASTKKTSTKKTSAKKAGSTKAPAQQAASNRGPSDESTSARAEAQGQASSGTASSGTASSGKSSEASSAPDKKPARKGITIVSQKPMKKASRKAPALKMPELGGGLLGPGAKRRRPLIPSGPSAAATEAASSAASGKAKKSPFTKRQLDKYRDVLLTKRRELIGDVSLLEGEALLPGGGGESHLPQHIAEQGSDTADQSLNLNLAAADRRLIREIDDALQRIADRTFGLCELTGEPIGKDRLDELPWARYSIEAARSMERRGRP